MMSVLTDSSQSELRRQRLMAELDRWVKSHGNGEYVPEDYEPSGPLGLPADYGIQQVRSEIDEFLGEVITNDLGETALEIGLGYYGSTHFLWRLAFKRVITIEKSGDRCRAFARSHSKFSGGAWLGTDGASEFILGMSSDPMVVRKAYDAIQHKADLLFIDGDHSYSSVLCDWLLYRHLVRPNGIIAFHDCATDRPDVSEVPLFLARLESGGIDGIPYKLRRITHSGHLGIAFYQALQPDFSAQSSYARSRLSPLVRP